MRLLVLKHEGNAAVADVAVAVVGTMIPFATFNNVSTRARTNKHVMLLILIAVNLKVASAPEHRYSRTVVTVKT